MLFASLRVLQHSAGRAQASAWGPQGMRRHVSRSASLFPILKDGLGEALS